MFKQLQKMYDNFRENQRDREFCKRFNMDLKIYQTLVKNFDMEGYLNPNSNQKRYYTEKPPKGLRSYLRCPNDIVYSRDLDVTKISLWINEKIVSNYSMIPEEDRKRLNAKYYIMILDQFDEYRKHQVENIATLSDYSNNIKNRFAVRAFPIETGKTHVLVEEVSEIVKLALQKNPKTLKEDCERAQMFFRDFDDKNLYRTVSLAYFEAILEKFEVDLDLITIVPDVVWRYTDMAALHEPNCPVGILNGDGELIMTGPQAMLYTFQSVVCGISWDSEQRKEQHEIIRNIKEETFQVLKSYWRIPEGSMIAKKLVDDRIKHLRALLAQCQLTPVPDCSHENLQFSDAIPIEKVFETCEKLGFPNIRADEKTCSVWDARIFYIRLALQDFFPYQHEEIVMLLVGVMGHKIPMSIRVEKVKVMRDSIGEKYREAREYYQNLHATSKPDQENSNYNGNLDASSRTDTEPKPQENGSEKTDEVTSSKTEELPTLPEQTEKCSEVSEPKPMVVQKASAKPTQKPTSSKPNKESQLCLKCTRNGQTLLKAQEKLKIAKKKAEKFESQSNKYDDLEKKMRKMKKEMEELKKENEKVKEESEGLNEELKMKNEKVEDLEKKNKDLEKEVLSEQQKNINHQQEKSVLVQKMEGIQLKFALEKSQLEHALSRKQMTLQQLNSMGSSASTSSSNSGASSSSFGKAKSSGTSSGTSSNHPSTSGTSSESSTASGEPPVPQTGFDPKLDCYICLEKFQEGQKIVVCKGCNNPLHEMCGKNWSKAQKELNVKDEACGFCRRRMEVQNQKNKKK